MLNFLFGWITKPQYLLTPMDSILATIEIWIGIFLVIFITAGILTLRDNVKEKRKNRRE